MRPLFFGACLTPLKKKDGGLRPIACGLTLRRLATKTVLKPEMKKLADLFQPTQMGCGIPGGVEAATHAARTFLSTRSDKPKVLIKLDFQNAFNTLRRDWLLRQVRKYAPRLSHLAFQSYAHPTFLVSQNHILLSSNGVQQGDPAGPALFLS